MIRSMCIGLAGMWWFAGIVSAQPQREPEGQGAVASFEELRSRMLPGETLFVVDRSGRETKGRAFSLTDASLTVAFDTTRREFDAVEVRRIDRRRRDPVRNGVLMGAAAGAVAGYLMGRSLDSPDCARTPATCGEGGMIGAFGGAFWGAIGGWITDALVKQRETIYIGPAVPDGGMPAVR